MKTILACLDTPNQAKDTLHNALPIARKHGSHLIGLHVQDQVVFYPGVSVHVPSEIYTAFQVRQEENTDAVKAEFDDLTSTASFPCEWRSVKAISPDRADRYVDAAHTTDMVIVAQSKTDLDQSAQYHAQEHLIRRSGRPVLHVPAGYSGDGLGKTVVVGWSPTRETARAVHDMLPLLESGAEVIVATVSKGASEGYEGATELARALDRHGFKADVIHRTMTHTNIAEELDSLAFERGADLIVTGAFGHSRLYDFVIGAVTLDLMRHARLPVLFSR